MKREHPEEQKGKVMTRRIVIFPMIIFVLVTLFLGACNLPNNSPIPTTTPLPPILESTATLVSPLSTSTVMPATSTTTDSPIPPTPIPPTPTTCSYDMRFVTDVSIPDDTVILPGQGFVKTWRIANDGNCPWPTGTSWVFADGSQMGNTIAVPIPVADPGAAIDVSVNLIAPNAPGRYTGYWTLRLPDGAILSRRFFVRIVVPAPSPTPKPVVILMDGSDKLIVYNTETSDNGKTNSDDIAEILESLPIDVRIERTSLHWQRQAQVFSQNPQLIIIHSSAFFENNDQGWAEFEQRFEEFLQSIVDTHNNQIKLLIYSRVSNADPEELKAEYEKKYPELIGRVNILFVERSSDFTWAAYKNQLISKVSSILGSSLNQ